MRAVLLVAARDLRTSVRNRTILVLGFVVPLALSLVFDAVFGTGDEAVPVRFDLGLVVLDDGPAADGFASMVEELGRGDLLDIATHDTERAARRAVDDGDVDAAWVVPEGFSAAVAGSGDPELVVVADVDSPTAAQVARAIAQGYGTSVGTGTLAATVAATAGAADPSEVPAIAREVATADRPVTLDPVEASSTELDARTTMVAGLTVFFSFFLAGTPILSLLGERTDGTLARLLAAPVSNASILGGKVLAGVVTAVGSLTALLLATGLLMGIDWGPPAGALLLVVAVVLAAFGIMSIAGAFARTAEQAGNAQAVVAVVLGFLSGTFVQIPTSEGSLLSSLALVTPNRWFMLGIGDNAGDGVAAVVPAVLVLLAMAAVTGAVGISFAGRLVRR